MKIGSNRKFAILVLLTLSPSAFAQDFFSTKYLRSNFEAGLCTGRWSWAEQYTEVKVTPPVTQQVPVYEEQTRIGDATEQVEVYSFDCVGEPSSCLVQAKNQCFENTKAFRQGLKFPEQWVSSQMKTGSSTKFGTCYVVYKPLIKENVLIRYDTVTLVKEKTDITTINNSLKAPALGMLQSSFKAPQGREYNNFVCSSGDHFQITADGIQARYAFLTAKLDEFDQKGIDPNTCDDATDQVCAEYKAIIKNYLAIVKEYDLEIYMTFEQSKTIFNRHDNKYPLVGYPEHLVKDIPDFEL